MALTTYNITGSLEDAFGGSALLGEVTFTPYGTHDARVDGADAMLGSITYLLGKTEAEGGVPATLALTAGSWIIVIRSKAGQGGAGQFKTITRTLDLQAPVTWGAIVSGAISSPPMTPTLVEQAQDAAAEAEMWASTAQGVQDTAVQTLVDDPTSATRASLSATYVTAPPLAGKPVEPSGNIAWAANPPLNFAPRSVGVDGALYFTYLNTLVMRSTDPTLAARTAGPDFASKTPSTVQYATRTSAGYVVITDDTASDVGQVWFCPASAGFSANLDDWTMVQQMKATTSIAVAAQRIIGGVSWLVVGEYVSATPSAARSLWLSTDGGQTWTAIKSSVVNDSNVNSHWHCALIMPSGRIWASQGDGVNSWFGYTDDRGKTWVPVALPTTSPLYDGTSVYQQPTVLLDLGETIAAAPDRGNFATGVWAIDPDTGETVAWAALASGEIAHTQYGSGVAQRGKEAYVTFPDQGSGSAKTYILGTADGGRSWHLVSTIDTTGGSAHGPIIGPDLNGKVYMQPTSGSIPTYSTGIMVGTLPTWA